MQDRDQPQVADRPSPAGRPIDRFSLDELKALFVGRVNSGWRWDDAAYTLSDPHDAECYFRIDPRTHRMALSPRLSAQLQPNRLECDS